MKKIMFNDRYGLTQAVLEGRKTMTRRIIPLTDTDREYLVTAFDFDFRASVIIDDYSRYRVGEEVAVAQSYSNLRKVLAKRDFKRTDTLYDRFYRAMQMGEAHDGMPGWNNKMYVKAEYMPHHIRITDIKVERLQDISDEEAMREGIEKWINCYIVPGIMENQGKNNVCFDSPREAFAALIDRISGRGTWQSNPWVYAYTFELIK